MKLSKEDLNAVIISRAWHATSTAPDWIYKLATWFGTKQIVHAYHTDYEIRQFFGKQYYVFDR